MFQTYLRDSHYFFSKGLEDSNEKTAYMRAAIFHLASAVEAFVSKVAYALEEANTVSKDELDFLKDRKFRVDADTAVVNEESNFNAIDKKLRYLVNKYVNSPESVFRSNEWAEYLDFKRFRNELVHPKNVSEDFEFNKYNDAIEKGLRSTISLLNQISLSVYGEKFRKSITDLSPS